MEITRTNFKSQLADIKSAISNASFIAIDCEFSGLNIDSDSTISPYDSYEQYYDKVKRSVNKFLVFQLGLCAFRYDKKDKKFKQNCFNFYLFPRPTNKTIPDQRFICQASSLDFLANHGFNFNKVFHEGLSYLNQSDETKYRQFLEKKFNSLDNSDTISDRGYVSVPKEDQPFVDDTMKIIKSFLDSDKDELMLPQCNSFRRRLIYQTFQKEFESKAVLETRNLDNKDRVLYVTKPETPERKVQRQKERYEASLSELEEAAGFSRVIQYLSESRKLVVGHNSFLDLLHIVEKFLIPLPDYEEFKECLHCLLPKIIDTKFMGSSTQFKDLINNTVLSNLVNILTSKPFDVPKIEIEENGQGYTLEDNKQHESGYDAFITGLCFLSMAQYIHKSSDLHIIIEQEQSKLLKPFLNKIFLHRLQDNPYINLSGKDAELNRQHVLHVTFPKEWKIYDLTQLFSPFGNIQVSWLNDTSAYVALYRKEQTVNALRTLSRNKFCTITSYAKYQAKIKSCKRESDQTILPESKKRKQEKSFEETSDSHQSVDESETIANRLTKMFEENSTWG